MNANARVYVSMDQQWNRDLSSKNSYDVRDLLVSMNQVISSEEISTGDLQITPMRIR